MTNEEKNTVSNLRKQGYGYKRIAGMTGISVNTIKSFCNTKKRKRPDDFHCMNCGKPISHIPHKKKRKFCSDKCRMDWWKIHSEKREKSYAHNCLFCGKDFYSDRATSKYCSVACFADARRRGEDK